MNLSGYFPENIDKFLKIRNVDITNPPRLGLMNNNDENQINTTNDDFTLSEMTADNVSWGVDLMHKDCAPLQYLREFTENGIQAIEQAGTPGKIVWTFDRNWYKNNGSYKAAIIDNGIGMTGREIAQYINKIFSSGKQLGLTKNYGIGAKIAAAPLNPRGIEYWTWKEGIGYLAVLRRNSDGRYGLQEFQNERGGTQDWQEGVSVEFKPKEIDQNGVKVVLLGESDEDNTYFNEKAEMPSRWILRYLNSRYFEIPERISITAPSIRYHEDESIKPMFQHVRGMKNFLDKHIQKENHYGQMKIYNGTLHWWLLDKKESRSSETRYNYHAQSGVLFQNEMYNVATMQTHRSRMQKFNLLYTYDRVAIFIEPNFKVRSNTARSNLLMEDESQLPWEIWAREFSNKMPDVIREMEAELFAKSVQHLDKEIKERLRKLLLDAPLSRFQLNNDGDEEIDNPDLLINNPGGQPGDEGEIIDTEPSEPRNPYSDYIEPKEKRAERKEVKDPFPTPIWKTIEDGTRQEGELEDRAAEYLPGNDVLNINGDFRVYKDLLTRLQTEKGGGDPSRERSIEYYVRREYKFCLMEATMRTKLLNDNPNWSRAEVENKCLSPEGLTEVVMSNYHLHYMLHQNIGRWLSAVDKGEVTLGGKNNSEDEYSSASALV